MLDSALTEVGTDRHLVFGRIGMSTAGIEQLRSKISAPIPVLGTLLVPSRTWDMV
jgi:hypothetical protein